MKGLKGYFLVGGVTLFLLFGFASAIDPLPVIEPNHDLQGKAETMEKEGLAGDTRGKDGKKECNGIKLNTNFPIIGNCIESSNTTGAFPTMVSALTKIVVSLILVVCFILIIVGGIMRAADKPKEGKALIIKVAITILLLGFSGIILKLINPNFFG